MSLVKYTPLHIDTVPAKRYKRMICIDWRDGRFDSIVEIWVPQPDGKSFILNKGDRSIGDKFTCTYSDSPLNYAQAYIPVNSEPKLNITEDIVLPRTFVDYCMAYLNSGGKIKETMGSFFK